MTTNNHSRALHMAHYLDKNAGAKYAWSDTVARAWYFVRFRDWLNQGVVRFSFFKKDCSIREAIGTTNLMLIPEEKQPKGTALAPVYSTINFFDLVKGDWRSFNILSFIGFVDRWLLVPFRTKPELKENRKKEPKKD